MTPEQISNLKKLIAQVLAYYGRPIDQAVIAMYASDLSDLDFQKVFLAYEQFRRDAKNKFAPLPAHIREIVLGQNQVSDISQARDVAARIIGGITKFGGYQSDNAKEYIGEVGWLVVQMHGGWSYICEAMGVTLNPNQCEAQYRDHALSLMEKARAGTLDMAPLLPQPKQEKLSANIKALVGSITKEIPK